MYGDSRGVQFDFSAGAIPSFRVDTISTSHSLLSSCGRSTQQQHFNLLHWFYQNELSGPVKISVQSLFFLRAARGMDTSFWV